MNPRTVTGWVALQHRRRGDLVGAIRLYTDDGVCHEIMALDDATLATCIANLRSDRASFDPILRLLLPSVSASHVDAG
jgi:hypothetical protein